MGAIVNRELKQRVRPVNGIVAHRPVAKADIKHAAKIIQNLDHKWNIWDDEKQDKEKTVSVAMATISHFRFRLICERQHSKCVIQFVCGEDWVSRDFCG